MTLYAWFRKNNLHWNGDPTADPSTGTGGISLAPLTGPYFPVLLQNTGFFGGFQQNVNFGATPFAMPIPSGAISWNAFAGLTTLNPSDKGGGVTLSNGNLTMSLGGEVTGQGARGTTSITDNIRPLLYFESVAVVNPQNWAMGLANSIPNMSGTGGVSQFLPNVALLSDSGEIGVNTVTGYSLGERIFAGDIMCMAIGPVDSFFTMSDLKVSQPPVNDGDHWLTMRYSNDAGANWSTARRQTMGETGQYLTDISFRNVGFGRSFVVELSWSTSASTALTGLWAQSEISKT